MKEGSLSIWFLIGLILTIYGLLITGAGVYQYFYPPENLLVLAETQPGIWWGLTMLIVGLGYVLKFRPRSAVVPVAGRLP